ncbi:MAG TPA: putative sulfate exporter family transporter [Chloroflexota bacterium]|jgi:uncharacterized integral membrane protein (TIGR00698 family)|nr:putative sulfate exporter family transporter [Chloroflexota bacterium]
MLTRTLNPRSLSTARHAPARGREETLRPARKEGLPALAHALRTGGPGLMVAMAVAIVASLLAQVVPLAGAAVIAIVLGIAVRALVGISATYAPGVRLASRRVLQLAIVLLGTGLSLTQVWQTGRSSLLVMLGTLVIGLAVMLAIGRALGIDRTLTRLISAGTGICGASAIGALSPVLEAEQGAIAYAISTIFLFNICGVLLFPPIGHLLGMSQHGFGLWAGTAINDTSSVVAAAYSYGAQAGAYAVVVKLTRTVMIVPVVLLFGVLAARERRGDGSRPAWGAIVRGLPLFIVWFLLASALNTAGLFHPIGVKTLPAIGQFLIVIAMAGVGLSADPRAMARTGPRPILLGLLGWICIASVSLLLQQISGGV